VLPKGLTAVIDKSKVETQDIFRVIQKAGGVPEAEMWRTFNMGLGMVVVLDGKSVARARSVCPDLRVVGELVKGRPPFRFREGT